MKDYAASLLKEKVEKRQICSSTTEEKWMFALRHIFGWVDEKGTVDVGIKGIGEIFVDKLTRADIEAWRDSWEPRINAGKKSPTTVNDWIAVLRVITKRMKADHGLLVDPCADVEDVSTKGHRTFTFEQPNSLGVDELSAFFEIAWEKYPQHFAVILLGSVTGLRPSSLYALRRSGENADVKWDQGLILVRRSRGIKGRVMEMTKTNHDQVIKVPDFVISVLRWHVDKQMITREMERSDLLFPSEVGTFRGNSTLAKPFKAIAKAMGLKKQISPKAMRRSFQDAMREAQVANVVVRSIRATSPSRCSSATPPPAATSRKPRSPGSSTSRAWNGGCAEETARRGTAKWTASVDSKEKAGSRTSRTGLFSRLFRRRDRA